MKTINKGQSLTQAAARTGISRTTARRYRDEPTRLSEPKPPRTWRTRTNPFEDVWDEVATLLSDDPALAPITLWRWLNERHPARFKATQLPTFRRHIHQWHALHGT